MTTLDFSPAPGAASAVRRVVHHGLLEAKLLARNGEQLLLALVIPLAVLFAGRFMAGRFGNLAVLTPSVLALAIWSSAFTSVAIATGFERRYGVLERLAATPLGKSGLLAGKALAVIVVVVAQLVVLSLAGLLLGWRPAYTPMSVLGSVALVVLGVATNVALALLLAGRLRAEVTLGLANLVYVIFLVGGALVIPVIRYPEGLRPILQLLPTAALGEGLRAAAVGHLLGWPFLALTGWLAAAGLAARKGFRWTS